MLELTRNVHYAALIFFSIAFVLCAIGAPTEGSPFRIWGRRSANIGFILITGLLIHRWNAVGFLPVTGLFSTLHFLSIWMVGATLYFTWRYQAFRLLPATLALVILALLKASGGDMALKPLTPALDTPLFLLHVSTSFAAYGLFAVGALISFYRLLGLSASDYGHERRMLDECIYLGYVFFSWCMIAGSLWAYLAWGSYWTWRIKGLWSTILWFYYSGVLHIRNRGRWQGWPLDLLTIAGFALVLFTFLGLGLLFETSHPLN